MWKKIKTLSKRFIHFLLTFFYEWERVELANDSQHKKEHNEKIVLDFYRSKRGKKKKNKRELYFFHPVLAGDNSLARFFSNYFTIFKKKDCCIIHRAPYPFESDSPKEFERIMNLTIDNITQARDYIVDCGWKENNIMAIGTSMGAIVFSSVVHKTNFGGYILIMGGAPIIDVICGSSMSRFNDWKKKQKEKGWGSTKEKVCNHYREEVETDPIKLAPKTQDNDMLFITTSFDSVVPTRNQRGLVEVFSEKNHIDHWKLPAGHYTIILFLPLVLYLINDFSKENL